MYKYTHICVYTDLHDTLFPRKISWLISGTRECYLIWKKYVIIMDIVMKRLLWINKWALIQ